jgi:hypothetical protein
MAPHTWPPTGPPPLPVHPWDNTAPSPLPPTAPVPSPLCSQTGALEGQLAPSTRFFPHHLSPHRQTRGASPPRSAPPGSPLPTSPLPHVQVALTCPLHPTPRALPHLPRHPRSPPARELRALARSPSAPGATPCHLPLSPHVHTRDTGMPPPPLPPAMCQPTALPIPSMCKLDEQHPGCT